MNLTLPIVVVDDDEDLVRENVEVLELSLPGRSVVTYSTLTQAISDLMRRDSPFVLVLDHDFPPEGDSEERRKGQELAQILRSRHPWGLLIPICYLSGRFSPSAWAELGWHYGPFTPDVYVPKGERSIVEVVECLDTAFRTAGRAWLRQAELLEQHPDYDELLGEDQGEA